MLRPQVLQRIVILGERVLGRAFTKLHMQAAASASERSRMSEQHGCAFSKSRIFPERLRTLEHALIWPAFLGHVLGGGGGGWTFGGGVFGGGGGGEVCGGGIGGSEFGGGGG